MSLTIYHNPRCSKSRETLELLNAQGASPEIVEYLKHPLDRNSLEQLLQMLGLLEDPRAMMRTKEAAYQELGLDQPGVTRDQLIQAMIDEPRLIERPIVVNQGRAVIARPSIKALDVLQ